jgi:F-box-like
MLNNRHNYLQPINPIETFAIIFQMMQDHTEALFPPATIKELEKWNSWLSATHVCQYWRQCSLASPRLWQNIVLGPDTRDDGSLGALFLSNSKSSSPRFSEL